MGVTVRHPEPATTNRMNNIIQSAINNVNETRNLDAIRAGQGIIGSIESEQKSREVYVVQVA